MVSFVVEEVERVKQLFEEKQGQLTAQRDAAVTAAKGAAQEAAAARQRAEEASQQVADASATATAAEARLATALADAEVSSRLCPRTGLQAFKIASASCSCLRCDDVESVSSNCVPVLFRQSVQLWRVPRRQQKRTDVQQMRHGSKSSSCSPTCGRS